MALEQVGWSTEQDQALQRIKDALVAMVPLKHPDPTKEVCWFTDASLDHWGAVVTQVPTADIGEPLDEQQHEPLAFLSGKFVGAPSRWAIVEKEAFAIVESCKRLEYLLLREQGFRVFTDHRNLAYIFDPLATDSNMARYQADKLQRWAMTLTRFKYQIEHVAGEDNVWGDLLSRWGATKSDGARMRMLAVTARVAPLRDPEFLWPTANEIVSVQRAAIGERDMDAPLPDCSWNDERKQFVDDEGRVWIPDSALELQQRLCVIAHAGESGHRGEKATTTVLEQVFVWSTLRVDVRDFVQGCIHCLSVDGTMEPRPYGPTLHATKPNECLHFDFLTLPESDDGYTYVLVLKDDMSGWVELVPCKTASATEVYQALMDCFKRFGVVHQWVSDQGSHFKNQVVDMLRRCVGGQHRFTLAYCPWANGTVEVVNRTLIRCLKAVTSEMKLAIAQWTSVLPLVQSALNHMPADRLDGTAFTMLPAQTALTAIMHCETKQMVSIDWIQDKQQEHLQAASDALDEMHKQLSAAAEKRRQQARERRAAKRQVEPANFVEGDFVLVGQVLQRANKLAVQWRGPQRVVRACSDHVFEVQELVEPFAVAKHHAARLKFYADASRGVTEDLTAHALHAQGGNLVEDLLACRLGAESQQWEIQVKWTGLDVLEASWEPADIINEDVPKLVKKFVDARPNDRAAQDMMKSFQGWKTASRPRGRKGK